MPAEAMVGLVGRVTGAVGPGEVGEVTLAVRGGSESFHAYSEDPQRLMAKGTRVIVVEYYPPRTVVVAPF